MSNAAVSRYLSFITMLGPGEIQMCNDGFICVWVTSCEGCACMCLSIYLLILSTCKLIESFQYCLLAVFKCLLNTVFGRSAECSNEMWEMCDFIILCSHNWLTRCLPPARENASFGKLLLPLWNSIQRVFALYGTNSACEYMYVCVLPYIHDELPALPVRSHWIHFFFSPSHQVFMPWGLNLTADPLSCRAT